MFKIKAERPQRKRVKHTDPFWDHVEKTNDGGPFKCKFCQSTFAASTSISRFKYHLSGESGKGVGICGRVPVDVKTAAYQAMHKKQNAIPPIDHTAPNVEAQRMEQEGRDLRDLAMEDWTESTRWEEFIEELMVIDEAGGSQGQGVYEGMLDTENLTHSRTVEGIELIDQGADVSDGGVQNLTDNFTGSANKIGKKIKHYNKDNQPNVRREQSLWRIYGVKGIKNHSGN
ncbi:hypothetical protein POTOM_003096 [Populus tomentosa]|uniref:BED-type domain-containing protein n=1 Tax=Populus tomentosa TaxID=118781 RepID=A0A8X8IY62_POPTO|nr:hypothetical protein POTOM_003096 [Populus tomentosa]